MKLWRKLNAQVAARFPDDEDARRKHKITRRQARHRFFHIKAWPSALLYGLLLKAGVVVNLP